MEEDGGLGAELLNGNKEMTSQWSEESSIVMNALKVRPRGGLLVSHLNTLSHNSGTCFSC